MFKFKKLSLIQLIMFLDPGLQQPSINLDDSGSFSSSSSFTGVDSTKGSPPNKCDPQETRTE